MAASPKKRARAERAQQVITDVHSIDVICTHIAAGGTLADWCRGLDIRYNDINGWIEADPDRRARYDRALALRDTHHKDRVIEEIGLIMQADLADAFDENGCLRSVHDMPAGIRRAIASIEIEELFEGRGEDRKQVGYVKKVKLWDKVKGVELMARRQKMLTDKHEVQGKVTLADLLTEAAAGSQT